MFKRSVMSLVVVLISSVAWAHPPAEITLEYDKDKQVLHVAMTHVSQDMKDHYIRKVDVYKNNAVSLTEYPRQQTSPTQFVKDLTLPAKLGEQIRVEAFCSEGGSLSQTLTVTDNKEEAVAPPAIREPFLKTGAGMKQNRYGY